MSQHYIYITINNRSLAKAISYCNYNRYRYTYLFSNNESQLILTHAMPANDKILKNTDKIYNVDKSRRMTKEMESLGITIDRIQIVYVDDTSASIDSLTEAEDLPILYYECSVFINISTVQPSYIDHINEVIGEYNKQNIYIPLNMLYEIQGLTEIKITIPNVFLVNSTGVKDKFVEHMSQIKASNTVFAYVYHDTSYSV